MRRCLLIFEPPDGGVADHVLRLATGLAPHGWAATVAGPPESNVYPSLAKAGIPVRKLPVRRGMRHPVSDLRALRDVSRMVRGDSFDIVHTHSSKAGVIGRIAALTARVPAIYTPNCFPFAMPTGKLAGSLAVAIERRLGRRSAAIICVAEQERALALDRRIASPDRLHVIHNATDACTASVEPDGALASFRGDGPLAACLTVLRPQKSVHTFLEAAPEILRRVPHARLAVVGDGPLRSELEARAAELGVAGRVGFFPFRPPPARQLASIDVFVLPSAWEAFPIAILEAMACGVPQVATAVGGTPEAVVEGETALLVPPADPAALAERVVELLLDPKRRAAMGEASRARHAALFQTERMVAQTAELYERLIASRPDAPA